MQRLYPSIQFQLLELNAAIPEFLRTDATQQRISELVKEIQSEFQSLIIYESKMVFPAVTKWFHKENDKDILPYLTHLLALARSKEQRLLRLIAVLDTEYSRVNMIARKASIGELVSLFLNNFKDGKELWNQYLAKQLPEYNESNSAEESDQ